MGTLVQLLGYKNAIMFDGGSRTFLNFRNKALNQGRIGNNFTGFQFTEGNTSAK